MIRAAAVFLVLGAAATVGVAWAAALWSPRGDIRFWREGREIEPLDGIVEWGAARNENMPFAFHVRIESWGHRYDEYSDMRPSSTSTSHAYFYLPEADQKNQVVAVVETGWPLPAMRMSSQWSLSLMGPDPALISTGVAGLWKHGVRVRETFHLPFGNDRAYLPIRPIPPGFVGNMVFYGGVFAAAWYGGGWLRRRRRRKRGLCPRCAYPVRMEAAAGTTEGNQAAEGAGKRGVRCTECGWLL